jgi:TRAP transporter 4TM/12TM fusion protein
MAEKGFALIAQSGATALVKGCAFLITVACILWNLDLPLRLGFAVLTEQYLALVLGLAVCILFLTVSWKRERGRRVGALDICLALLGLGTLVYTAFAYVGLLNEIAFRPPIITFIGAVVTVLVLEGVRRNSGWALFIIVAVFIVYALMAHLVPGPLIGRNLTLEQLVQYIGFDPSAVFGTPLKVGATVVILFVFFGTLLFIAGGGEFFTDLSFAVTGRTRGGAAKIAVVASALFGSISGSAVSNVVTTGVITIPLMRRGGYSKNDAGAIESVASTGGQLAPPIMGAAAFLMAEFLEIPYMAVAMAAIVPAVLYYFSVFVQVDLMAARDRFAMVDQEIPRLSDVLKRGWHLVIPFAVLLYALFGMNSEPEDAAMMSAVVIVVVGFLRPYREHRLSVRKLLDAFVDTGTSMVELILIVAAAGFVIGILNITGLGFALTLLLVDSVGGSLVPLLLISAFMCIVLGMGMPTSGVYVLLAALVGPAIVEAGIDPIAAHLFLLYFGMMSMITPPIALAAFAAAAIAKADAMATGLAAVRIGWASFVIPFIFVGTPALLLKGPPTVIIIDIAEAMVGIFAMSVAVVGYFGRKLGGLTRLGLTLLGAASLPLALEGANWDTINLACALFIVAALGYRVFQTRRSVPA